MAKPPADLVQDGHVSVIRQRSGRAQRKLPSEEGESLILRWHRRHHIIVRHAAETDVRAG